MTRFKSAKHYPQRIKAPQRQQGVVLVVVVAAVVMLLILLATMVEDQHILVRRVANQKVSEQGFQYAQGVNAWAERVLHDDKNREVDYLGEDWAKFGRPEPEPSEDENESFSLDPSSDDEDESLPTVDFGFDGLEFSIDDLQAKYNLNNLAVVEPQAKAGQKRIFINLLEQLEIGEFDERERLYGALVDWIDENDLAGPNGVESGEYAVKSTPYFAADQKLTSIGELMFVEGYNEEIVRKLKPYVTVLPVENSRININTTSPEVLASLSSGVVTNPEAVLPLIAMRESDGFVGFQPNQITDAETAIIGVSASSARVVPNMLQVKSQFFQINAKVTMGDYVYCMQTVVLRESPDQEGLSAPKVNVLSRQHNTLCEDESAITNSDETVS